MRPDRSATFFSMWLAIPLLVVAGLAVAAADARSRSLALNTLQLVAGTLTIALPVGGALGLLLARTDLPLRRALAAGFALLLVLPLYLQAAAWQSGFGLYGWYTLACGRPLEQPWLVGWRGAIWVHSLAAVPWVALFVGLAARQVERQLEEAALLDASPWQVFLRVSLRRVWPAIGLAALWVGLQIATDMTVTDLYQVRTYAEEVYVDFAAPADMPAGQLGAWAGAIVVAALAAGAIVLCVGMAGGSARLLPKRPHVFSLAAWRWPTALLVVAALAVALATPLGNLIYKAGVVVRPIEPARAASQSPDQAAHIVRAPAGVERAWSLAKCLHIVADSPRRYADAIGWWLLTAAGAACCALLVALPLAWLARRGGWGALPTVAVVAAALAIPVPLLGIGLIYLLNDPDLPCLGWMYHTPAAPMLAQAIRALPLATFIAWFAFRTIPQEHFEAAALDGAGGWSQWARVAIPQRRTALAAAWAAALLLALAELPATVLLEAPGRTTLPIVVFQLMHGSGEDRLAGLVLLIVLAYAAIMGIIGVCTFSAIRTRAE